MWGTRGGRFPSQITPGLMLAAIPPRNRLGNAQEHTHVCCGAALPSAKTHTHHSHGDFFFHVPEYLLSNQKKKRHYSLAARPVSIPCATPSEQPGAVGLWLWLQPRSAPWAGLGQGRSSPRGCGAAAAPHPIGPGQDLSWGAHLQGLASSRVGAKLSGGTRQVSAGRELGAAGKCVLDLWPWELLAGCARGSRGAPAPQGTA